MKVSFPGSPSGGWYFRGEGEGVQVVGMVTAGEWMRVGMFGAGGKRKKKSPEHAGFHFSFMS